MKDNPHITEITIDYNLQTGTGSVYYGDIQFPESGACRCGIL